MARVKIEVNQINLIHDCSLRSKDYYWRFELPQYGNITDHEYYGSAEEALAAAKDFNVDFDSTA